MRLPRATIAGSNPQKLVFRKGNTICNICRVKKNLTYDHVPPQCCGNDKPVVARRMYADELIAPQVDAKSLNGLKFKTLCRDCNGLIGNWDGASGEFAQQAKAVVESHLTLPESVTLRIRAGAVVRSVLGHIAAVKVQDDDVPLDALIRGYLLTGNALGLNIKVYCWLYPYAPTVVSRDFATADLDANRHEQQGPGLLSIMKFYPLAFCIVDGDGEMNDIGATPLHQFTSLDATVETDITLALSPLIHPAWPERAFLNHLVVGGRTYMDSVATIGPDGAPPATEYRV